MIYSSQPTEGMPVKIGYCGDVQLAEFFTLLNDQQPSRIVGQMNAAVREG